MVNTSNSAAGRKILPNNQQPPLLSHGGSGSSTLVPPTLSTPTYAASPSNASNHLSSPSLSASNSQGSLAIRGPPALNVYSQGGLNTGNGGNDIPRVNSSKIGDTVGERKTAADAKKAHDMIIAQYEKNRKENLIKRMPKLHFTEMKKEREQKEKAKISQVVQPIPPKNKGSKPKKDTSAPKAAVPKPVSAQPAFGVTQISQPQKNSSQTVTPGNLPSAVNTPTNTNIPAVASISSLMGTTTQQGSLSLPQNPERLVKRQKLSHIVQDIDPRYTLAPEVEDVLLQIADDFIDSVTTFACMLAKHRKSEVLEPKDITLHLERNWNIAIPGFFSEDMKGPSKRSTTTELHRNRSQQVKKALATSTAAEMAAQKQKETKKV